MDAIANFPMFLLAALALALLPGPDTMLALGKTIASGRRAGLLAVIGIGLGCCVHVALSTLGLSAMLAASPTLYTAAKWAGALYLAYLGVQIIVDTLRRAPIDGSLHANAPPVPQANPDGPASRRWPQQTTWVLVRQGLITNILNPKVGLFFISFLPQFVRPGETPQSAAGAFALLGFTFVGIGWIWMVIVVYFADAMIARVRQSSHAATWTQRGVGALFLGLAGRMVFAD